MSSLGVGRRVVLCAAALAAMILPALCRADGLIIIDNPPRVMTGHFSLAPLSVSYHHEW